MLLSDLCKPLREDARADIDTRHAISSITRKAMRAFYFGAMPNTLSKYDSETILCFYPETLGLSDALPDVAICLAVKKTRFITAEMVPLQSAFKERFHTLVIVYCMTDADPNAIKSATNSVEFMTTLNHELTHVFDRPRLKSQDAWKAISPETGKPEDLTAYYNDPAELNAYYHDIADGLTTMGEDIAECTTHAQAMDMLGLRGMIGDFRHDLVTMKVSADYPRKQFLQWLTKPNQNKLVRRLYLLHTEIMRRVNALP